MRIGPLIEGRLVRRYKRFLADIEFPDGSLLTVHCPNTGAMTGCAAPGDRVWLSRSESKTRKYAHTWELVETSQGMACIHSALANKVVREALEGGVVPELRDYPQLRSEVKYGVNSRIDLLLEGEAGQVFIEVKSVTLCREGGRGVFPDAVSERGRKHLRELQSVSESGGRAVLFFCVLHQGIESVSAAGDIDRRYRDALKEAMAGGVEVLAWRADITPTAVDLSRPLPFTLDP